MDKCLAKLLPWRLTHYLPTPTCKTEGDEIVHNDGDNMQTMSMSSRSLKDLEAFWALLDSFSIIARHD